VGGKGASPKMGRWGKKGISDKEKRAGSSSIRREKAKRPPSKETGLQKGRRIDKTKYGSKNVGKKRLTGGGEHSCWVHSFVCTNSVGRKNMARGGEQHTRPTADGGRGRKGKKKSPGLWKSCFKKSLKGWTKKGVYKLGGGKVAGGGSGKKKKKKRELCEKMLTDDSTASSVTGTRKNWGSEEEQKE